MNSDSCPVWNPDECEGAAGCPPRCPRFIDKQGEPALIEPYQTNQLEWLVSMYAGYPDEHRSMGLPPVFEEQIYDWLESLIASGANFVARKGDRVIGHAAYAPKSDAEPELIVFVDPERHERGIGTELCKHIIAYAADAGHDALVLDVDSTNKRAISVYRRMGFNLINQTGNDIRMRLPFDTDVVETVQCPPAERKAYS